MSLLFRNTIIHQVFGANTDVGKTIITTALIRAVLQKKRRVLYLKPVSTGPVEDEDDRFLQKHLSVYEDSLQTQCLYRFQQPVSPHLAAKSTAGCKNQVLPTDKQFVTSVAKSISEYSSGGQSLGFVFVETAGGVHSPILTGTPQVEAYRPLLLPSILIGESKLGGISTTISAYESLHLRGYSIDAVLLFKDDYYRNYEYLEPYFKKRGIECYSFTPPPPQLIAGPEQDRAGLSRYFSELTQVGSSRNVSSVVDDLVKKHDARFRELESMSGRARDKFWWPFVQHGLVKSDSDVSVMDSAYGDYFNVYRPQSSSVPNGEIHNKIAPYFDGSASWWTQAFGHSNTDLTLAAAHASGRYGHVMFPQAVHLPALRLAERMLKDGPGKGWASRVFFSDDGSTAMEVALKMALRSTARRYNIPTGAARKRLGILGLAGSYHGDTIGAMDACQEGDGVFTCEWHDAKGYWIDPPTVGVSNGLIQLKFPTSLKSDLQGDETMFSSLRDVYGVPKRRESILAAHYREYFRNLLKRFDLQGEGKVPQLGALVLEPLVMGAGGMIFVDPLFQTIMVETVRELDSSRSEDDWKGLPVIFDEVFIGLHRLGFMSAGPVLGVQPDISANAKILTGGLVPLSTTLARESIFNTFLNESKADALLHGHSYTAYPVGCAAANKTFDLIEDLSRSECWKSAKTKWEVSNSAPDSTDAWSFWSPDFVIKVSHNPLVAEVMALGTVLAIKFKGSMQGYVSSIAQKLLADLRSVVASTEGSNPTPDGSPFGAHYRTLGNVAYLMGSLSTEVDTYRSIEKRVLSAIEKAK